MKYCEKHQREYTDICRFCDEEFQSPVQTNRKKVKMTTETEQELSKQVTTMINQSHDLVVYDQESLDVANQFLVNLSGLRKKRKAWFEDLVDKANKAHKALTKRRAEALAPIDAADAAVRLLTGDYEAKERVKQQKEQDRLDKLAEDKTERERKKLEKKIDKAETQAEVNELEDKKDNVYVEPKIAECTVQKTSKVEGGGSVTFTTDIDVKVINIKDLCGEVHSGHMPESIVEFKPGKIKSYIKMMDIKNGQIKGIRITETHGQQVRGG